LIRQYQSRIFTFRGHLHHPGEEEFHGLVGQQKVLVLGEGTVVPDRVHEVEVQEPAEEKVLLQRLDKKGFAADGVEGYSIP
jgi:hypothetical protein